MTEVKQASNQKKECHECGCELPDDNESGFCDNICSAAYWDYIEWLNREESEESEES